ncbi:glycosyltransferase family 2 protein [Tindallia californiensis]|uniref:Dolichol-phosphate mannosyltransferase/undecaprenyl-phosphate 4-deoxy-4-formamido-L-arabinose transferase n=1 Tax=Tindallia californiensis TaxID=159292 RepID=A0A1H3PE35_9FIRM|nr:glycosyltransferase family 2 protein [Tindallia californiensis]SDY98659.1 dolichol-phosphate mannosyltransferase/undecaprenyl-phosphate 4-deoxy-4-formamido-L-arabinose transferase [Tindallia californiensis]
MMYSVVIPVYNSEKVVKETVSRIVEVSKNEKIDIEIILVNDGSYDNSWNVIKELAQKHDQVKSINLLKNYGQHVANLCGFNHALGEYIITMDDDMQNPPEEIPKLISRVEGGYDLVIGEYYEKKHSGFRKIGSKIVAYIVKKIFKAPADLKLSNFRIAHKEVINRVCSHDSGYPYIPGLLLMYSSNKANVKIQHLDRKIGESNYRIKNIIKLVFEILFNYSAYPLRIVATIGLTVSLFSLALSVYYVMKTLFIGSEVPGWASIVVLLSFFNGISLLVLGMIGEYMVRLLKQTRNDRTFFIKEKVGV